MSKIKEFFAKVTSTKKGNIIFMVIELCLVLAIALGSVAGVALSTINDVATTSSQAASSTVTLSSSDVASVSSEIISSSEGSSSSEVSSIDYTVTSSNTGGTEYEYVQKEVPTTKGPLTKWPETQFLPRLPEPASVLDYFVTTNLTNEELLMFTSLKGIVNKTQPRIYTADVSPELSYDNWISKLKLKFNKVDNPYTLIDKYKSELAGLVVYDDTDKMTSSTINLACTIAGTRSMMVVSPALYKVIQKKYHFKNVIDLRELKFTNKWDIYEYMYDNYLEGTSDRVICGLNPEGIYGHLRDYGIAIGANFIYLDPQANKDVEILDKYFSRMKPGKSVFMGWWTQENNGVNYASEYGVVTLAADYSTNLSVYAGMYKGYDIKKVKTFKAPKLENKIYVSYIISDGDNLQYCEGFLQGIWSQNERGQVPIAWTLTPSMADIARPLLHYYTKTMTDNDVFISGPSAYGYFYPGYFTRREEVKKTFPDFLKLSNEYFKKLGWRSITVWNWSAGEMSAELRQIYADNMTSLLGISQQENMVNPVMLYNKDFLIMKLDGSYCSEMFQFQQILDQKVHQYYSADGKKPVFVTLQAVSWNLGANLRNLTELYTGMKLKYGSDIEFVRLDQLYQLMTKYEQGKS